MLPKENRFKFKGSLPRKTIQSQSFSLRFDKNSLGKLQVGVVVSKKVDNRATVRNKIKRQILEAVRKGLKMETGLNLVFYAKKGAESSDLAEEVVEAINHITI